MAIPNFLFLLEQVLKGESKALVEWLNYSETKQFTLEEMALTLAEIEKASLSKNPIFRGNSYLLMGVWNYFGIGGEVSLKRAIKFYEQAIALDNSTAMVLRAVLHEEGNGGLKNPKEAIILYKKAIRLGNSYAMTQYANLLQAQSIKLYNEAIRLGNMRAMVNCGLAHELGAGDYPADLSLAIELYDKAIELGYVPAMNHRAKMYELGVGGEQSSVKANSLYDRAIRLGDARAALNKINLSALERQRMRMEYIQKKEPQLDSILNGLEQKIKKITDHHFTEAVHVAYSLLRNLKEAKEKYMVHYKELGKEDANYVFEQECKNLINKALPVLERDLNWRDYLINLLRTIVNVIMKTITFGHIKTLFPLTKSELVLAVGESDSKLTSFHPT